MNRIFITGGHLTPALAVIEILDKSHWEIFYIGRKNSLEGEKSLSAEFTILSGLSNLRFLSITTGRLQRRFTLQTIPSFLKIPGGFFQSLTWLIKYRPAVVLSFGGYVAVPVVFAAWILGIPTITHEQTLSPSLSARLISPLVKKILVSWPEMLVNFPKGKTILTGNPVRKEVFAVNNTSFHQNFIKIKKQNNLPTLFITGGSQGSHSINSVVAKALPKLLENYIVIHQCGNSAVADDYEILKDTAERIGAKLTKRYFLSKFFGPQEIGWVFFEASIIVSRSGANTISEIAALARPAILIPLPWSGGSEQQKNAEMLEKIGSALIIPQNVLTAGSLQDALVKIKENMDKFTTCSIKAQNLVDAHAADKIVSELNQIL